MTEASRTKLHDLLVARRAQPLKKRTVRDLQEMLVGAAPRVAASRSSRRAVRWRPTMLLLLLLSPTLAAALYYGLIATDRYESTASFVVRTASKPAGGSGLGAFLRMAGLSRAEDDTYSVQSYLTSRDALAQLEAKLPLTEMYRANGADLVARYPSVFYGATQEQLYKYYIRMTSVSYNATTGVMSLGIQAFRPQDAQAIAIALLGLGEEMVNRLNARIHADALSAAEDEVKRQEARLTEAQVALTTFQTREKMIDPIGNSGLVLDTIGKLQNDLAQIEARAADMTVATPNNPGLIALKRQTEVTRAQIERERSRISSGEDGLADKLGQYQRLVLEREFATKSLALADTSLDNARTEARRKQLYIERIVEPNLSDHATLPQGLWTTLTVFLVNMLVLFIGWMLSAGVKEHMSSLH